MHEFPFMCEYIMCSICSIYICMYCGPIAEHVGHVVRMSVYGYRV